MRWDDLDPPRLRAILAAADEAFFAADLNVGTVHWTPGIALVVGPDAARANDRLDDWLLLVHPKDRRALARARRSLSGGACSLDLRIRRTDGTYAPVRVRAFAVESACGTHVVGSLTDLSPVREMERELREASQRAELELARARQERVRRDLFEQAPILEVIWEWTLASDRLAWSSNVEAVLGYPAHELATIADVASRSPDAAADTGEMKRRIEEGATTAWSRRFTWVLPSGDRAKVEGNAYVLRSECGHAERVIGSLRRLVPEPHRPPQHMLTPRQRHVLGLVRLGRTNKEIAHELGISEQAAKVQVSKLMRKFGVANRAALAVAGLREASF